MDKIMSAYVEIVDDIRKCYVSRKLIKFIPFLYNYKKKNNWTIAWKIELRFLRNEPLLASSRKIKTTLSPSPSPSPQWEARGSQKREAR